MRTATSELEATLAALPTGLVQRLVDRLETKPDLSVSVGSWRNCPMTIAGINHFLVAEDGPEHRFANAWDSYAFPCARLTWRDFFVMSSSCTASRRDVQTLLRLCSAALATQALTPQACIDETTVWAAPSGLHRRV